LRFAVATTFYQPYNFGGNGIANSACRGLVRREHHVTVIYDADAYEGQCASAPCPRC
jgi:hypothetical protein